MADMILVRDSSQLFSLQVPQAGQSVFAFVEGSAWGNNQGPNTYYLFISYHYYFYFDNWKSILYTSLTFCGFWLLNT